MKVLVRCPQGHTFRCAEEHLGRTVHCPQAGCGVEFTLEAIGTAVPADAGDGDLLGDQVRDELHRLESPAAGWARGIVVLVISVAAFFLLGVIRFSPVDLALLAVIIILHELGHLAAMRLFGYTNLRVFLIPLFGGAASGRKTHAPGWQRAVVALAGPLPGLLIGYVLLVVSLYLDSGLLTSAAGLFIILNALNLLPFFPLDGGRLLNDVLFCRQHLLETAFHVLTALAIAALGLLIGAWIITGFGVLMLLGARASARINSMASRLQGEVPAAGPAPEETPPEITARIVAELRDRPGYSSARTIARVAFHVWQRINTRPPGATATLVLLLVYGAAWVSALAVPVAVGVLVATEVLPAPTSGPVAEAVAGFKVGARGGTELHYAASLGDAERVRRLIAAGHAIDARDHFGVTPLMEAAASGDRATIEVLLHAGADPGARSDEGMTALDYALWRPEDPERDPIIDLLRR